MLNKTPWVFLVVFAFLLPNFVDAQEDKIGSAIASVVAEHPYRVGIFRVQPRFVLGTSYDSNAFSDPDTQNEISDYYTVITPGGSFGLKLGRRAYFVLEEYVNFLFYQNRTELNDIFNATSGRFGIGSRKLLVELNGNYFRRTARVDSEFDQIADQRFASGNLNLYFALRQKTDLTFDIHTDDENFSLVQDVTTDLPIPPDTKTFEYGFGVRQDLSDETSMDVRATKGYTELTDVLDLTFRDNRADYWRIDGGFDFHGKRVVGRAKLGYEDRESIQIGQGNFQDLVIDANVDYAVARRLSVGGFARRQRKASALDRNDFRLVVEAGARGCVPVAPALFLDGLLAVGKNDYGPLATFHDQLITKDNYRRYEAGANFTLPKNLVIRVGTTYTLRDSNVVELNKNRFTVNVGLALDIGRVTRVAAGCSPVSLYH